MEEVTLNNGVKMPQLGLGTYQISNTQVKEVVSEALKLGYRHLDTADYYGNEGGVGAAVKATGIKRSELFLTSKLTSSGYQATLKQIDRSLMKLQTDYLDLMLIHWVIPDYQGTYQALIDATKAGKLRAWGLSNFQPQQIEALIAEFGVKPAVLQNQMHILQQQKATRAYTVREGIQFESWAPFGEGLGGMLTNPTIQALGQKYGKTPAQIILRFLIQEKVVAIPKTANPIHMRENLAIFDFQLSSADIQILHQLDEKRGLFGWGD
ncbi:aldo/keto reductase [Ligilactobacillus equi]|uniref:aldo/keto reductase n=1 Tax=Ligilactobacillus equi TaxID=137357 RepID=UPI002ED219E9